MWNGLQLEGKHLIGYSSKFLLFPAIDNSFDLQVLGKGSIKVLKALNIIDYNTLLKTHPVLENCRIQEVLEVMGLNTNQILALIYTHSSGLFVRRPTIIIREITTMLRIRIMWLWARTYNKLREKRCKVDSIYQLYC